MKSKKTLFIAVAMGCAALAPIAFISCTHTSETHTSETQTSEIQTSESNQPKKSWFARIPAGNYGLTIPEILETNQDSSKYSYTIPFYGFQNTSRAYLAQVLAKYCSVDIANNLILMKVNREKMEYADAGLEAAADKLDQIFHEQISLLDFQRQHGIIQKDDKNREAAPSIIAYAAVMRMHAGSNAMTMDEMRREGLTVKTKEQLQNPRTPGHDYRTHQFMKTLCGEYHDRPTMIEAKINWINTMHVLTGAEAPPFNPRANPWKSLNGQNYTKYLAMSDQVWILKKDILKKTNKLFVTDGGLDPQVQAQLAAEIKALEEQIKPLLAEAGSIEDRMQPINDQIYEIENSLEVLQDAAHKNPAEEARLKAQLANLTAQLTALRTQYDAVYAKIDPLYEQQEAKTVALETPFREAFELAIPGQSVCETKFMIGSLVYENQAPFMDFNKTFRADGRVNFPEYIAGYRQFRKGKTQSGVPNCTRDDFDYLYDFRGDANFKPQSPESNGMIWHAQTITKQCANYKEAKKVSGQSTKVMPDEVCRTYFEKPFASRYMAARSTLATWLFRKGPRFNETTFEDAYSDEKESMWIYPNVKSFTDLRLLNLGSAPRHFSKNESIVPFETLDSSNRFLPVNMSRGDLGFNALFNLNGQRRTVEKARPAWHRLRDAVNRHTDWYASGYNDGFSDGMVRAQAYSPFVASSYEMSKSDTFVAAGYTVPGVSDFRRHWMYVFKIKRSNWYRQLDLVRGKKINFDKNWLDETTLGTNHLAKEERAFDRLGSPMEKEFDTIIYLHNLVYKGAPKMVEVETETVEIVNGKEVIKKVKVWKIDEDNYLSDGDIAGNFILQPVDPTVDKNQVPR